MSNRVVLVSPNQAAADSAAEFIMGTYVGIGAVLYGIYWLIGYFTPVLLSNDLGILTYIVAPLAIALSALLLVLVLICAISFKDPITQIAYACLLSYFVVPVVRNAGWIGYSKPGKIIGYILAFIIGFTILHFFMKPKMLLKTAQVVGGCAILAALCIPFWQSTSAILSAAGWF